MDWSPHPRQAELLSRQERELLGGGSRGGGKTEAGIVWIGAEPEYIASPYYHGLVIRKSFKDLSDWIERARMMLGHLGVEVVRSGEIRYDSGAIVYLGHWGDPGAIGNYLGREFQKILIEELTDIFDNEGDYLKLLGSLRSSHPELKPQLLATTNPGGKGHAWVKKRWVNLATNKTYFDPIDGSSRIFIPFKVTDNPDIVSNDPGYINFLDSLPERIRAAWRDGSWDIGEGAFFTTFNPATQRETSVPIDETSCVGRLFAAMDIGVGHATAFTMAYIAPDDHIYEVFTYCNKLSSIRDHAREILRLVETHKPTKGYMPIVVWVGKDAWTQSKIGDSTQWRAPIDEFKDLWPKHVNWEMANDARANGCMIMQDLFRSNAGRPQFTYLGDGNGQIEEALQAAQINPARPEEYIKTSNWTDDLIDCLRYLLTGCYTWITGNKQSRILQKRSAAINAAQTEVDWYNR